MKSVKDILTTDILSSTNAGGENPNKQSLPQETKEQRVEQCPLCEGRGIIYNGDTGSPCSCMQQKKLENRFRTARIARDLLNCRFEKFRLDFYRGTNSSDRTHIESAQRALMAAQEFVDRYNKITHGLGLLYSGPVGSGKTYLAASIVNALIEKGHQALFLVVPDLLDELRSTYDRRADLTEMDLLDTARCVPVLVLDDLGAHNYTDWARNRLYSIINYRMNEQLPTIITTNLTLEEMEEYLGDRTTSRLLQMTRVFRMTCQQDIRLQNYQEREGKR